MGYCLFGGLVGLFSVCLYGHAHAYSHVSVCVPTRHGVHVNIRGQLKEAVLSFHHMDTTVKIQAVRVSCKHPCPISHLASPEFFNLD